MRAHGFDPPSQPIGGGTHREPTTRKWWATHSMELICLYYPPQGCGAQAYNPNPTQSGYKGSPRHPCRGLGERIHPRVGGRVKERLPHRGRSPRWGGFLIGMRTCGRGRGEVTMSSMWNLGSIHRRSRVNSPQKSGQFTAEVGSVHRRSRVKTSESSASDR